MIEVRSIIRGGSYEAKRDHELEKSGDRCLDKQFLYIVTVSNNYVQVVR